MHVVSLHTYPVKGCHRVDHDEITIEAWGVVGDRRWLIIDEAGTAVTTQRDLPGLTGLRASSTPGGGLRLRLPWARTPGRAGDCGSARPHSTYRRDPAAAR
jgi:uncharacterized protein YcbX